MGDVSGCRCKKRGDMNIVGRRHCGYASSRRMRFCLARGEVPSYRSIAVREEGGGGGDAMMMFMHELSILTFQE